MLMRVFVTDEAGAPVPCRITVRPAVMPDGSDPGPSPTSKAALVERDASRTAYPIRDLTGVLDMAPRQMAYCMGTHVFALPEGTYEVIATRGLMYRPAIRALHACDSAVTVAMTLRRMFDPKAWGLWSFDGHSHVSRDDTSTAGTLQAAILAMRGEDFNYFFAGAPYDVDDHAQYLSHRFSDTQSYREKYADLLRHMSADDFTPDIGNELYKGRYGHAFLMNYTQTSPYSRYYDDVYDVWQFGKSGNEPALEIPYLHEALVAERTPGSVSALAHPTSWWTDNGQFITNIATTVGFDVLAGTVDALVILGYRRDCPQYQALWFELMNNGYRIPGITETDEVFDRPPEGKIRFKTYVVMEEDETSIPPIDRLCDAIRKGRCVASSGPVMSMRVDGHVPGSTLSLGANRTVQMEMACRACFEGQLTRLQIITNGIVTAEYPLSGEEAVVTHQVQIDTDSYVLAKCWDSAGNTAITNPVHIRNKPFRNVDYHASVQIRVKNGGLPCSGMYQVDSGPECSFSGEIHMQMRPASVLRVKVGNLEREIRLVALPALQEIFQSLYLGRFNESGCFSPGEVPVEAFQISRIREILDAVVLEIEMT